MAFLQQGPADTVGYMIAGYVVIFGAMAVYLVSLLLRNRTARQDMDLMKELDEKASAKKQPKS
jgi:hypothetical protein